ncbi:MAG: glycoside hydrolase family 13 protein [Firmicutes bacterium]|nr:glycoside hydrolase family 13 protein [Bacillota bacterium]
MTTITHNPTLYTHRCPLGAAKCGETVRLSLEAPEGTSGDLVLYTTGQTDRFPLFREGKLLSAYFAAPDIPHVYYYHFLLHTREGDLFCGAAESGLSSKCFSAWPSGFQLTVYAADFEVPAWFQSGVMYQIFPDRFARSEDDTAKWGVDAHRALGRNIAVHESWDEPVKWRGKDGKAYAPDDYYCGTLEGIRQKLPYMNSLGITVLYLNPIFEADSNHRYNTADYLKIDPILGDLAEFDSLCSEAREYGVRVMLDGVFSHTGSDSVYFNKERRYTGPGAYQGEDSSYYPWYDFQNFPDKYRCWWGFPTLPEVKEENPDWQAFIYGGEDSVVRRWLRLGASAWRLDVADELPDDCLRGIYASAKAEDPDSVVLGEVWDDPTTKVSYGKLREYALGGALDSVMNYPLRTAILDFACARSDAFALADFLLKQKIHYPQPMYRALMNLLSSHDVPRVRTALGADVENLNGDRAAQSGLRLTAEEDARAAQLQAVCAALLYALPGIPCLYYGDELGMQGAFDPFNRAPFAPDGVDLTGVYVKLGENRSTLEPLKTGDAGFFAPDGDTLCILRVRGGEAVLTVGSRVFSGAREIALKLDAFQGLTQEGAAAVRGRSVTVALPAAGWIQGKV